jgi:hypothetical protein
MTKRGWGIMDLFLWGLAALLAGCASEAGYRGGKFGGASINEVPASVANTDPALRQWYAAPYFNPYEMP